MKQIERLRERLGGVTSPKMQGDNLAILLCSHFDNPDQDEDENGWTEDAIAGMYEVLDAIHNHYTGHIDALEARVEEAETIAGIATIPDVAGMAERLEAAERALAEAVRERDALRSASTIIRQRDEAVEVLGVARIALLYARDTFSHYELQHLDKQTPEGNAKADANARHANHMSQALATISKIAGKALGEEKA